MKASESRQREWRRMRVLRAVLGHGWQWLLDGSGRPLGLRSRRGTIFECRRTPAGYVARPRKEFQLVDA